jgi:uroporphyrinogen-III decarboxylase
MGLCGNVDCGLMLRGTPEQVHAAVVAEIRATQGRGFWILGCTNAVQPDVLAENYRAFVTAVAGAGA